MPNGGKKKCAKMENNEAKNLVTNQVNLNDGDSFDFLNGLWTGKKPPFSKAIIIRNTNFSNDGMVDHSKIAILDVETKQLENRILQNHDIIIERSGGGPKQPVGRVVLFEKTANDIPYSFSNFTSAIRVKDKNKFDPIFVFYYLFNFYKEGKTDKLQRRTTGIRNLDFNSYKNAVLFPDFDISEQKRISKVLRFFQDTITGQKEMIDKLKKLKNSMMQHLFTHGTKNEQTKMTEIGEIPESWKIEKLGEMAEFKNGINFSKEQKGSTGIQTIDVYNMYGGKRIMVKLNKLYKVDKKMSGDYLLKEGDVLFVRSSLKQEGIGWTCYFAPISPEKYTFCGFLIRARLINAKINPEFLTLYSRTDIARKSLISGSGKVAITNINQGMLSGLMVPLPGLDEQKNIVESIYSFDQKIESAQVKLSAYQKLFKTLLHELMSGERRIK